MASFAALEGGAAGDFAELRERIVSKKVAGDGATSEHGGVLCDFQNESMYHVEMLNDTNRNDAFVAAVERAVAHVAKKQPVVALELGAGGAALLSLAAARAGATVVAVECDPVLAERAATVVDANGLKGAVTVVAEHSFDLEPSTVKPQLVLAELFDDRLLGECVVPTMRHAIDTLAAPGAVCVPVRAVVYAVAVRSETLRLMSSAPLSTGVFAEIDADAIEPIRLRSLTDLEYVSEAWPALTVDMGTSIRRRQAAIVNVNGRVDAVAFWWRATLWEDAEGSIELSSADDTGHWKQCVSLLPGIVVNEQQSLRVVASAPGEANIAFECELVDEVGPLRLVDLATDDYDEVNLAGADDDDDDSEEEEEAETEGSDCCGELDATVERPRRWMLAQADRTATIFAAVAAVASGVDVVATVCGGASGLCAEAARRAGAQKVVACEWTPAHAAALRESLGSDSTIVVVDGAAENLGEALQNEVGQVNALIAEPYFAVLGSEVWAKGHALLWWWSVQSARKVMAPDAAIWPRRAVLRGQFVKFEILWDATRKPVTAAGFSLGEMFPEGEAASEPTRSYSLWQHAHQTLGEPLDLLHLDFAEAPPPMLAAEVKLSATAEADALVLWLDYELPGGGALSTGPSGPTPWAQGVHFLSKPTALTAKSTLDASLDPLSGALSFNLR